MDWLGNVIANLQKRFGSDGGSASPDHASLERTIEERRTTERVQLFQWRLSELDRRLSELR